MSTNKQVIVNLQRASAQPWEKNMVLVALTGWGHGEDRQKSGEAGFDGHIVKPVDHAALTKLLAELSRPKTGRVHRFEPVCLVTQKY